MARGFKNSVCALIYATCVSGTANADEIARLAKLSKSDFMTEYEIKFDEGLKLYRELLHRFDPDFADVLKSKLPMLPQERAAVECSYDLMKERGQIRDLAAQIQTFALLDTMMRENPELDYVDATMNIDVVEAYTSLTTDETMKAMIECDHVKASKERYNMSPEFWSAIGAAAQERGFLD
jgi:hypothetical protein